MGRVIHTDSTGKSRNRHRRTIAELMRRLGQKDHFDAEAQDMAATIVLALVAIDEGVQQTVQAWEKRDYWMKAERFIRDWGWVKESAANLDDVLRHEAWDLIPDLMMDLFPRFTDIQINKFTRSADTWQGNYAQLLQSDPLEQPY
jgi:hypothetical protein